MGPSPLKAIKNGDVTQNYDTKFTFAEVNSETLYWRINKGDKEPTLTRRLTDRVGMFFFCVFYLNVVFLLAC